jgi:hypothetical protein
MAAPHASGVAALVRSLHPEATPEQVRQILRESADDIESPGRDLLSGYGRVNAARAVALPPPPVARIASPETEATLFIAADSPIRGTVDAPRTPLRSWQLTVAPAEDATQAQEIAAGTGPIKGVLGQVAAQLLAPGHRYILALSATDTGGVTAHDRVPVVASEPATLNLDAVIFTVRNGADPSRDGFTLRATFDGAIPLTIDPDADVFRLVLSDGIGPLFAEDIPLSDFRVSAGSLVFRRGSDGIDGVTVSKGSYPYYKVWVGAGRSGVRAPRDGAVTAVLHLGSRITLSAPPISCRTIGHRVSCG